MNSTERALQELTHALWATLGSFLLGAVAAVLVFWGEIRPFAGPGLIIMPMALISALIAAIAFVVSTLFTSARRNTIHATVANSNFESFLYCHNHRIWWGHRIKRPTRRGITGFRTARPGTRTNWRRVDHRRHRWARRSAIVPSRY